MILFDVAHINQVSNRVLINDVKLNQNCDGWDGIAWIEHWNKELLFGKYNWQNHRK